MFRSRRSRGQASVEFMMISALLITATAIALISSWARINDAVVYQELAEVEDLLTAVSEKIDTVWLEGSGFRTNLTLPERLASGTYTINVTGGRVSLLKDGREYVRTILTENITGELSAGINTLSNKGDYIEVSVPGG